MEPLKAVDIHTHMYPTDYIKYLERREKWPKIIKDSNGSLVIWDKKVRAGHVNLPAHIDPEYRIRHLSRYGISRQAVSLTTPGVHRFERKEAVRWARKINDYFSRLNEKYPEHYACLAVLPYNDVGESLDEMERAFKELGLRGIIMFTNINGRYIDEPEFQPIFQKAVKYDLPILLHGTTPPDKLLSVVSDYSIPISLWPYLYDETICFTRLVWNGILDRLPTLKIILAHLGAFTLNHLGRLDYSLRGYGHEYNYSLSRPPSYYFTRILYYDTANFYPPAVESAYRILGSDRLLLGSDYPHRVGDPDQAVRTIKELPVNERERQRILWENASIMLRLDRP